jgi:hypothetical protein
MALPFLSVPQFPDVPDVPGVPPVLRNAATTFVDGLVSGAVSALANAFGLDSFLWGVYSASGLPALLADNVAALDYAREFVVPDFPVEGGSFQSYNKVERPYDVRITLTKGGSDADRRMFLSEAEAILASTGLFTVLTPEWSYGSCNCVHLDYERTAERGATLLRVELGFRLIRATASASFTNTKTPAGAANTNTGPVLPANPSPAQSAAIDSSLEGPPN